MKHQNRILALSIIVGLGLVIAGCSLIGPNPGPPTGIEKVFYNTQTNYVPIVQVVTNYAVRTEYLTNVVPVGVNQYQTNVVQVQQTNAVVQTVTNQVAAYTETLKPGVTGAVTAGGSILNTLFPGVGAIGVQALLALFGGWGYLRSSKLGNTSNALAQEIETVREFIRSLPNGTAYDAAFVNYLQAHQGQANVLQQVTDIISNNISNDSAKVAASQITQFLQQLQAQTPLTPTPAPGAATAAGPVKA